MSTQPTQRGPKKWPNYKAYPESFYDGSKWVVMSWQIRDWQLDAMVERMARAIYGEQHDSTRWQRLPYSLQMFHLQAARAALKAIGITQPKERK